MWPTYCWLVMTELHPTSAAGRTYHSTWMVGASHPLHCLGLSLSHVSMVRFVPQVRNLTYMVTRREKIKRSLCRVQEQIFQHRIRLLEEPRRAGEETDSPGEAGGSCFLGILQSGCVLCLLVAGE